MHLFAVPLLASAVFFQTAPSGSGTNRREPAGPQRSARPPSHDHGGPPFACSLPGPAYPPLDLTEWRLWWENELPSCDAYGTTREAVDPRPIEAALRDALASAREDVVITSCLVALAKCDRGAEPSEPLESLFVRHLGHADAEVREAATLALGILGRRASIPPLAALVADDAVGRRLLGREVDEHTRALAAFGLGRAGARSDDEEERRAIVGLLSRYAREETRTHDLAVSCVVALGLVPSQTAGAARIEWFLASLADPTAPSLVRAHAPRGAVHMLASLPPGERAALRPRIAEALLEILERPEEHAELLQSATLALGALGTNDVASLDRRIRAALVALPDATSDLQTRDFAMIALAQVGARFAEEPGRPDQGIEDVSRALLERLAHGDHGLDAWAGLGCGILARELVARGRAPRTVDALQSALRAAVRAETETSKLGAFAIACGLAGDPSAAPLLVERLEREKDEYVRGDLAQALALLDARGALGPIDRGLENARNQPTLLIRSALALHALGDAGVVPRLAGKLREASGLATQGALAVALGSVGGERAADALLALLASNAVTPRARAFAAEALGRIADDECRWSAEIARDLNYRATTPALADPSTGTGILDWD